MIIKDNNTAAIPAMVRIITVILIIVTSSAIIVIILNHREETKTNTRDVIEKTHIYRNKTKGNQ